jgi:hypothetical protein
LMLLQTSLFSRWSLPLKTLFASEKYLENGSWYIVGCLLFYYQTKTNQVKT